MLTNTFLGHGNAPNRAYSPNSSTAGPCACDTSCRALEFASGFSAEQILY